MGVTAFVGGPVVVHGPGQVIRVRYRNWRGEVAVRSILPLRVYWGCNMYHVEPQWLLECTDMQNGENRDFAMGGVLEWGVKGEP